MFEPYLVGCGPVAPERGDLARTSSEGARPTPGDDVSIVIGRPSGRTCLSALATFLLEGRPPSSCLAQGLALTGPTSRAGWSNAGRHCDEG